MTARTEPGSQSFKTTEQYKKTYLRRHKSKLLLWTEEANARRPVSSLEVSWRHMRADPSGLENSLSGRHALGIPGKQFPCLTLLLTSSLSTFNWQPRICYGFPRSSRHTVSWYRIIGLGLSPRCLHFRYTHISISHNPSLLHVSSLKLWLAAVIPERGQVCWHRPLRPLGVVKATSS